MQRGASSSTERKAGKRRTWCYHMTSPKRTKQGRMSRRGVIQAGSQLLLRRDRSNSWHSGDNAGLIAPKTVHINAEDKEIYFL